MPLINYLTRVHFGDGVLQEAVRAEHERLKINRPLVVIDESPDNLELQGIVLAAIEEFARPLVSHIVPSYPREEQLQDAALFYRQSACDGVLGLGGSKVMHFAKLLRLCVARDDDLARYSTFTGGERHLTSDLPKFIAIPDFSGVSASISKHGRVVLKDGRYDRIDGECLRADIVICDPLAGISESKLVLTSGAAQALTLCLEAFLSTKFNPPADGIAVDGIRRIAEAIYDIETTGRRLEVRRELMIAMLNGALALEKGSGTCMVAVDYLSTAGDLRINEGTLLGVFLRILLQNLTQRSDRKLQELSEVLQIKIDLNEYFDGLLDRLKLPATLVGISPSDMTVIANAVSNRELRENNHALNDATLNLLKQLL